MNRSLVCLVILPFALAAATAAAQSTDSARTYLQRGNTAIFGGKHQEAVEQYARALRFDPNLSGAVYNTACAYSLMGRKKEAVKWLSRAVDLGNYMFDNDGDFDNIRGTREYAALRKRADKLLGAARAKPYPPVILAPAGDPGTPRPLLVALHGYGSNAEDFSRAFTWIPNRLGYIVCCPYGPEVMGMTSFSWGGTDDAERRVRETIADIRRRYAIDTTRIILAGFSQGGGYAYDLGLRLSGLFRGAIPMGAGWFDTTLAARIPEAARRGMRFVVMLGALEHEERQAVNRDAVRRLAAGDVAVSYTLYPGVGHALPEDRDFELERAIRWIERGRP
ncbi:MAG: hypothetical protein MUF78_10520 [Candidatus Edwardsbacteria bacterium]|nr:hypothetical protein [Candidatus Edwardsbacteria bacterium]